MAGGMTDEQSAVIGFLSRGASYGLPDVAPKRIETHASVVFLVGDRAYKLKRAVKYSYLDYSTVAARDRFCHAELALNRRTAPALYLDVRSITRSASGELQFGGSGRVVDWVVEMRRFEERDLFDQQAMRGVLTPLAMRQLADVVADFHTSAEKTTAHGGSRETADVVADNHRSFASACPPLATSQVEALRSAVTRALDEVERLLDFRRAQGMVRHCHGDLHLGNICLFGGVPTLFDAIEFSDSIACIDVLYDLAFLLMDLEHRGLRPLANIVFNRYLDRTNDYPGLPALPLFLSVRAAVRAKVALATLALHPEDKRKAEEASAYLDLAEALLWRSRPRLVAVGGFSGTGKSTVAAGLAPDFLPAPGARIIRSDVLRKSLMGVAPEARLPESAYDRQTNRRVYLALAEQAAATLATGYTAIVDAAFLAPTERAAIAAVARKAEVSFTGLWLEAPAHTLAARVSQRRNDASDADLAVLQRQMTIDPGPVDWERIDASGTPPDSVAAARRKLGLGG